MENIPKKLCRICLNNSGTISIYHKRELITIIDVILSVTNIQIVCNENYPNSICKYCLERIDLALNLREDVEYAERQLKQILAASLQTRVFDIKVETDDSFHDNSTLSLREIQQIQTDSKQNKNTNFKVESVENYAVELPEANWEINKTASDHSKVDKDDDDNVTVDSNYNPLSISEYSSESKTKEDPPKAKHYNLIIGNNLKTTEYPTKCSFCCKVLKNHPNLIRHLRVHTGEKPYECDICYKNFSQKVTLRIHKRCHTKEQPFTCEVCHRLFSHRSSLKRHMPIHDTSPKLLRYKCNHCFKDFRSIKLLQMHMVNHSDIKNHVCGICGKGFHRSTAMNQHIRTVHFKEKNHICTECGKRFGELNNLKAHLRIHTGEKPFECKYCTAKFNRSCTLHRHIIRRHQHMTMNEIKSKIEGLTE